METGTGSQYLQSDRLMCSAYDPRRSVGDITRAVEEAAVTTIPELVARAGQVFAAG